MNRFKNLLKNVFSYIGGLFSTHPVTFFTICFGTLTAFVWSLFVSNAFDMVTNRSETAGSMLLQIIIVTFIFGLTVFFIESSPLQSKMPLFVSIPLYVVIAFISFALGSLAFAAADFSAPGRMLLGETCRSYADMIGADRIISITGGLCITMLCLGIYFSFRKLTEDSFSAYLANLYSKLFFAHIINGILVVGVASLTGIFTALLWGDFEVIFFAVFMLITGGYLLMRIIASFVEKVQTPNVFISVLLRFVLMTMCVIAYVIIYIYMVKILVLREFPSNFVFEILTALFVVSIPIAYMGRSLMEAQTTPAFFAWSARFLPYVFSPFILLQIYTAGVRIRQYGLTPKRYFGLLFVAFEIAYIVLYAIFERRKERKMSVILPVLAGCALLSTWVPFLNAIDLSKTVQASTLRAYLREMPTFANDPKKLASRASAGYSYLYENNRDYLDKRFSEEERETLRKLKTSVKTDADTDSAFRNDLYRNWQMSVNDCSMDVSGYSHIQYAYLASIGTKGTDVDQNVPADLKKAKLYLTDLQEIPVYVGASELFTEYTEFQQTDLTDYAENFLDLALQNYNLKISDTEYDAAMQENQIISLNDGSQFYVMQADLRYDEDNYDIMEILLQGYYLSK